MSSERFPIRFEPFFRVVMGAVLMGPSQSYVELDGADVHVRMSWGFRSRFPRSSVASCKQGVDGLILGVGVHGFGGRWLVNGSLSGLVTLKLAPEQRAHVLGFPVKLRVLMLSLEAPEAFIERLQAPVQ
jgi:hypothetical protein